MVDPYLIIQKYYPINSALYNILITHSEQVSKKALEIANKHPELELDKQFIKEAALLHDIGVFMCDAPRIHCNGKHLYIEHGVLGAEILRKEGLDRHALVCERHTGTGLTKELIIKNNLPLPHQDFCPQSLEEQLICYADKYYSKTKLAETHSVEKIRNGLARYGNEQVAKFDAWRKLFD
jgi:uncharacterized protein